MSQVPERMNEKENAPPPREGERSAAAPPPDPEVVDKPSRRRFAASYNRRIVEEADRCTEPGEIGQLLRREGLYSSHLSAWRKAAREGSLEALSKKRGRKPTEKNPLAPKLRKLERENTRLEQELHKAHLIIDVQGKVAGLLELSLEDGKNSWRRPRRLPRTSGRRPRARRSASPEPPSTVVGLRPTGNSSPVRAPPGR